MYKKNRILAIIPARSGSKGLPGKNTLNFCEKPLIAWSIEQAKASKYLDKILVSTDGKKIADIAVKYGADVPFLRPKQLATSTSSIIDVLIHALNFLGKNNSYDAVLLLQPTSPLRKSEDVNKAIELFFKKNADSVVSVCLNEHHPYWSTTLSNTQKIKKFLGKGNVHKNRQSLEPFFRLNGVIYLAKIDFLKKKRSFFGNNTYAYIMPAERSQDIDTKLDFEIAQFLAKKQKCQKQ